MPQQGLDIAVKSLVRLSGRKRPASLRVAQNELLERCGTAFEEDFRQPARRHHAEGVSVTAGVLGGDQPLLAGEAHEQRAPFAQERLRKTFVVLALTQVSAQAQQVVELIGVARVAAQLRLDLVERVRIEQVAQLLLAEQLAQEVSVERQRLRPPLGGRRVVLVHVRRDVVEEERGRVGRGGWRLDVDEVELARAESREQPLQRRQVEDVLQTLAVRLEDDRERAVLARHLQESLRLEALLPQRRSLIRPAPWDEQRPGGVLAEARAEQCALSHFLHDQLLDVVGRDDDVVRRRRSVGVRKVQGDPVVRPDRLHLEPERIAHARSQRERPRSVYARAEGREDAEAPVADLVAEALDHDRAVRRDGAGRSRLLVQERQQIVRRALVEPMLVGQALHRDFVALSH